MNKKLIALSILVGVATSATVASAVGTADTSMLESLFQWVISFVRWIGVFVALFGGVQFALGFQQNNPDAKSQGIKSFVAGVMCIMITTATYLFGI
jgi:hypothetical protein